MERNDEITQLTEWLQERGHTPEEIEKILARMRTYEKETHLDSIMDSIGAGRLSLDSFIKEALGDS